MPYSELNDLLLDNIILSPGVDPQKFIDQTADDMDAKLGYLYQLPLRPEGTAASPEPDEDWKGLPKHQKNLLKGINNKLASGRLILTLDIAGEGTTMHAYGWQLVKEAGMELAYLANGEAALDAVKVVYDSVASTNSRTPGVKNYDDESLLLGFERTVMASDPWYSRPGALP